MFKVATASVFGSAYPFFPVLITCIFCSIWLHAGYIWCAYDACFLKFVNYLWKKIFGNQKNFLKCFSQKMFLPISKDFYINNHVAHETSGFLSSFGIVNGKISVKFAWNLTQKDPYY